jgi:hypothetical protein
MKRFLALLFAGLLLLALGAPALAADGEQVPTERVLISVAGDVALPAGEEAAVVVVVQGNALIEGRVESLTVVGGTATLRAAQVETLTIVDGTASLEAGTVVTGDVLQLNATVQQAEGVTVGGSVRPLAENLAAFALFIGVAAFVLWIGVALATLIAGLALAAFASRQVRTAEAVISREPLKSFLVGLAMIIVPPLLVALLAVTIIGLPLALSVLFVVWPILAFIGYLVAAIWIGDWLLRVAGRRVEAERPYLAAFVGLLIAGLLGFVPLVTGVISIFGLGAVTVAGWRTLTGGSRSRPSFQPQPAPTAG